MVLIVKVHIKIINSCNKIVKCLANIVLNIQIQSVHQIAIIKEHAIKIIHVHVTQDIQDLIVLQ
jgi:hypothetical protein